MRASGGRVFFALTRRRTSPNAAISLAKTVAISGYWIKILPPVLTYLLAVGGHKKYNAFKFLLMDFHETRY